MIPPLIFPYTTTFAVLDNTEQDQDDVFLEPTGRQEKETQVDVLAQVQPADLKTLVMWGAGRDVENSISLILHRCSLYESGLMDTSSGYPTTPKVGDRLVTIKSLEGTTILTITNPPGAFVEAVVPLSFGPGGVNALYEVSLVARNVR